MRVDWNKTLKRVTKKNNSPVLLIHPEIRQHCWESTERYTTNGIKEIEAKGPEN